MQAAAHQVRREPAGLQELYNHPAPMPHLGQYGPTLPQTSLAPGLGGSVSRGTPTPIPSSVSPSPRPGPGPLPGDNDAAPAPSCQDSGQPRPGLPVEDGYNLMHLELLHHFEHDFTKVPALAGPEAGPVLELAVREGFVTPYLMDELLALSAAHKSTLVTSNSQHGAASSYRTEAMRLQTRALERLKAAQAESSVPGGNGTALFLFSTFLGQHVLFDVFSSPRADLAAVLERFTHCLNLHRGIRTIAGNSWPQLSAQIPPRKETAAARIPRGTECATLMDQLLTKSQMAGPSWQVCRDAVEMLQEMFDSVRATTTGSDGRNSASRRITVVYEWPVRLPVGYVDLLEQRRPEALIILAYYGVLLHRARNYWAVGDAGEYLIRAITRHLGAYWADWLEWPNSVLASEPPDFS